MLRSNPPAPDPDETILLELGRNLAANEQSVSALLPVGVVMFAVLLGADVPGWPLAAWCAVAAADSLRHAIVTRIGVRRVAAGVVPRQTFDVVHHIIFGISWGSVAIVAGRWGNDRALWMASTGIASLLAVYGIVTATSRLMFVCGAAPMLTCVCIGAVAGPSRHWAFVGLVIGFGVITVVVHGILGKVLVGAVSASIERAQVEAELRQRLSERDPMTGLLNRDSFAARVAELSAELPPDGRLLLAVGNLRRMSDLNELHGEAVGSALLVLLAGRLAEPVSDRGAAARLGGDEFAIAIPYDGSPTGSGPSNPFVSSTSDEIRVGTATVVPEWHLAVIDHDPGQRSIGDDLAELAAALRDVRHRARLGTPAAPVGDLDERRDLLDQLLGDRGLDDVEAWFQPIVDSHTRALVGWEALVRWQHPIRGVLTPDHFLSLIDKTGLNDELSAVLVRDTARLLRELAIRDHEATVVHLNLTASALRRERWASHLLGLMQGAGLDPSRVIVEVTERDLLELDEAVHDNLDALSAAGVGLAVDDFGTGYSSLSHLLDLPTDHVKIDQRFVAGILDGGDHRALVAGVLGMARGMGLTATAEGVEHEAQATMLAQMGCDQIQGHLIAPAMCIDDAVGLADVLAGRTPSTTSS